MVARLDLLLYRDVPLAELARARASSVASATATHGRASSFGSPAMQKTAVGPGDVLHLPHTCVPSRMRLPPERWSVESRVLRRTCSGGSGTERGTLREGACCPRS